MIRGCNFMISLILLKNTINSLKQCNIMLDSLVNQGYFITSTIFVLIFLSFSCNKVRLYYKLSIYEKLNPKIAYFNIKYLQICLRVY